MAAPTSPLDLNTTASSNGPDGATEQVSVLDDYIRGLSASVKHLVVKGTDIASAATITPAATASFFDITGTTGITAIGSTNSWDGRIIWLQFDGALTITHASTLKLPGAVNYTTAAGDVLAFVQETSGTWRCVSATKASGLSVVSDLGSNWSVDGSSRMINSGNNQPAFLVTNAGNQTISVTNSTVVFDTETFDRGSSFASNTFTAPVSGHYFFSYVLKFIAAAATGPFSNSAHIYVNGATTVLESSIPAGSGEGKTHSASGIVYVNSGETVVVRVAGSSLPTNTFTVVAGSTFSGYLLS